MDWADELASRVSGPQVVNDSKTPSGTVHVGSLRGPVILDVITRALRAGAAGFILKDSGPQELIHAVRAAAHGGAILSPRITKDLIATHLTAADSRAVKAQRLVGTLNEREREVLVMVGAGASNAETARLLFMGEGTVKTYVSRILAKLGCANRTQAAIIAHDAGLLPDN